MKLWLLRPIDPNGGPWSPWYDKAFGFVVRAETEDDARALTDDQTGDEHCDRSNPWLNASLASCIELTPFGEAEVILRDFSAA